MPLPHWGRSIRQPHSREIGTVTTSGNRLNSKEVGRHPHSTNRGPDHRRGHVPDATPLPPQAIPWTRSRERRLSCGPGWRRSCPSGSGLLAEACQIAVDVCCRLLAANTTTAARMVSAPSTGTVEHDATSMATVRIPSMMRNGTAVNKCLRWPVRAVRSTPNSANAARPASTVASVADVLGHPIAKQAVPVR